MALVPVSRPHRRRPECPAPPAVAGLLAWLVGIVLAAASPAGLAEPIIGADWRVDLEVTAAELPLVEAELRRAGLVPRAVSVSSRGGTGGSPVYQIVSELGTARWTLYPVLTQDQAQGVLRPDITPGLGVLLAEAFTTPEGERYALLLRDDVPAGRFVEMGLTEVEFDFIRRWHASEGRRPAWVSVSGEDGDPRFTGIFATGGPQVLFSGWGERHELENLLREEGYLRERYLLVASVYVDAAGETRYAGIAAGGGNAGEGTAHQLGVPIEELRAVATGAARSGAGGLRPTVVAAREVGGVVQFTAGWRRPLEPFPRTGRRVPALAAVEEAVVDFIRRDGIPGAVIGVSRNGRVVLQRGLGYRDEFFLEPVLPDTPMRLASVTKPLTAAVIRELIDMSLITLDDYAFSLGQLRPAILPVSPHPELVDPRLAQVTVRHLLEHQGGWRRSVVGDLTYREMDVAESFGVPSPPTRRQTVDWILGQPLQSEPGTRTDYANIGYMVLSLIAEEVTQQPFDALLESFVRAPLGIDPEDLYHGRSFEADLGEREPIYHNPYAEANVFAPHEPPVVNRAYGSYAHELRVGVGALVATADAMLKVADARVVGIFEPGFGERRSGAEGEAWSVGHGGWLYGTTAHLHQRGDGVSFVILMNGSALSLHSDSLAAQVDAILRDLPSWPCSPADSDGDGDADVGDLLMFLRWFRSHDAAADMDGSGRADVQDLLAYLRAFRVGC